ncbi:unnamed protein product [Closterium sp. NIES-54]
MAAAVQANPEVVVLDSGCSHHLMGSKDAFVDLGPSGDVKHVRGFNGALQDVQGRGMVALQEETGRHVLIPDVLYVPGVRVNLLSASQLKENGVKPQEDGDGMLLILAAGDVLGRASYTRRVLCIDLRPCSEKSTTPTTEVVALRAIVSVTKSTPDRLHARLAHVDMNTIRSSARHEVATGLDLKSTSGANLLCVSCIAGKLARHTFPDQGSDADDVLAVVHVDLCGPFWVAANDGSLYFLLLKDRKTRYMIGVPREAVHRLREQQGDRPRADLPLHPVAKRHGGTRDEDGGGVGANDVAAHGRAAPLVAPRSTAGRLARWKAAAEGQVGPSPRRVRGEQGLGAPRHRRQPGSHHVGPGVLQEHVAGGVEVGARADVGPNADNPADEHLDGDTPFCSLTDVENVPFLFPSLAPRAPPLVDSLRWLTLVSASGNEGRSGTSPSAPAKSIAGARRDEQQVDVGVKSTLIGEEQYEEVQLNLEKPAKKAPAWQKPTGEQAAMKTTEVQLDDEGSEAGDDEGDAGESTNSDVVEVQRGPRQSGRIRRPPNFYVPAAFTTTYDKVDDNLKYDDAEEDEDFPELDPDKHTDPEHRWDISTMMVKEALASWKGKAVKATMEEEIRSLIGMGTWELVERPPEVNIMKNWWVLTTKYHIDDTIEREKARLVVKGFTQVYGTEYDETYAPVSSYVTLRIFLSIVAALDLNLMQLDMKNAFLQSKLDRVLYMYQPDYFNDGTGRVCKLLKSLYGLKQSPLLWYRALNGVLLGAGWKKSQVNSAIYFKVGADKVVCWVLVYIDDLLAASSSTEMLKGLKKLLEAAFELREISPVQNYLGLEIVRDSWSATWTPATSRTGRARAATCLSWLSQRIKCATLSSTESEYAAATESGKEGRRLRFLLADFWQLDAGTPTVLRVDNKSAITFAEGMGLTGNLKHMERRQAWLQHMVMRGKFSLRYIPTAEQPADFLTKALHYPAFNRCSVAVGQVRLADVGDGGSNVQQ